MATKNERLVIEANARKPYADEIKRLTAKVESTRGALELLLRKTSSGVSDFAGWHNATAADIGEVLNAARAALRDSL